MLTFSNIRNKARSACGETFVEVLFSLLIAALATALVASAILAANAMSRKAKTADARLMASVANAEMKSGGGTDGLTADIRYYGRNGDRAGDADSNTRSYPVKAYGDISYQGDAKVYSFRRSS